MVIATWLALGYRAVPAIPSLPVVAVV